MHTKGFYGECAIPTVFHVKHSEEALAEKGRASSCLGMQPKREIEAICIAIEWPAEEPLASLQTLGRICL